jgi:hypothetical protein
LAYKIAEKMRSHRDETLSHLVSVMANASMITREDVEAVASGKSSVTSRAGVPSMEGPKPIAGAV